MENNIYNYKLCDQMSSNIFSNFLNKNYGISFGTTSAVANILFELLKNNLISDANIIADARLKSDGRKRLLFSKEINKLVYKVNKGFKVDKSEVILSISPIIVGLKNAIESTDISKLDYTKHNYSAVYDIYEGVRNSLQKVTLDDRINYSRKLLRSCSGHLISDIEVDK